MVCWAQLSVMLSAWRNACVCEIVASSAAWEGHRVVASDPPAPLQRRPDVMWWHSYGTLERIQLSPHPPQVRGIWRELC